MSNYRSGIAHGFEQTSEMQSINQQKGYSHA